MDVTERKEAEAAREQRQNDKMRFQDEFLSHVSHELRSPLTAVKQFTTILLGGLAGDLNKEQREYQQIVLKNVSQLESMIGDILEVTRLETGKVTVELESVAVPTAVADTLNSFQVTARTKGVTLSSALAPDLPSVHADQTRLRQILIILVENAIKFTPAGGAVSIQAQLFPPDPRFLLLEVSDTGSGVSAEHGEKIFERLYQSPDGIQDSSRKGLGLGLYISKELVTRQGGQIWVDARPQGGSTFSFTLPVASLVNVMAPLLKNGKWPAASLALVMVEGSSPGGWPSTASRDEWSGEVHRIAQHCLVSGVDVLLPTLRLEAGREPLFIATFSDEQGAAALANRIQKEFQRSARCRLPSLVLSVTHSMVPSVHTDDAGVDLAVSRMAGHLEAAIGAAIGAEVLM
jgi:nitrogen-specific signal transduction histidine kinase